MFATQTCVIVAVSLSFSPSFFFSHFCDSLRELTFGCTRWGCEMLGDPVMVFGAFRIVGLRWFGFINTITTASLIGTTYQINFCVRGIVGPTSHCGQVFSALKTSSTQAKEECDVVQQKEIADDLNMRQKMEEVQAAHPELVKIKALDVVLYRNFSCPRLTPPKHLKAFHEGILKMAFCSEGQREVPRDALLELLECTCDLDSSQPWGYQRSLLAIGARFVARNAIFRRARKLRIPPDWRAVGFHATRKVGNLLSVSLACGTWFLTTSSVTARTVPGSNLCSTSRARLRDAVSPARCLAN